MVVPNLMAGFEIDEVQAEYIAEIKLRNINKEYILKRIAELDALEKEIKGLHETLRSDAKIKNIICKQLRNVAKKYGKPRKTEIICMLMQEFHFRPNDCMQIMEDTKHIRNAPQARNYILAIDGRGYEHGNRKDYEDRKDRKDAEYVRGA